MIVIRMFLQFIIQIQLYVCLLIMISHTGVIGRLIINNKLINFIYVSIYQIECVFVSIVSRQQSITHVHAALAIAQKCVCIYMRTCILVHVAFVYIQFKLLIVYFRPRLKGYIRICTGPQLQISHMYTCGNKLPTTSILIAMSHRNEHLIN